MQVFHCVTRERKIKDWLTNEKPPLVGEGYRAGGAQDQAAAGSVLSGRSAAPLITSSS